MPHEVEQREVCRALESLAQTAVPGVLSHPEWRKNHGASRVPPAYGKFRRACLELLTRSESDGGGLSDPPSQGLLQSSSHTCGYTSLPNMAPIIDTSGVRRYRIAIFSAVLTLHCSSRAMRSTHCSCRMQALARLTAVVVFLIPPLEVAIEMIRGLVRIGGFAFGMTLSLNTLLEKEYNLIGERSWSSAIKQSSLCVSSGIRLGIFFMSSS